MRPAMPRMNAPGWGQIIVLLGGIELLAYNENNNGDRATTAMTSLAWSPWPSCRPPPLPG